MGFDLIGVTMKTLKALPLALAILSAAALAPLAVPGALAQVTNIDVQWAISSIMMAGKRANQVPGIKKVPSVGVIRLDIPTVPMFRGDIPDWQDFKIMTQKNAAGVAKLQKALAANPVTRAALAKHRVQPWQVARARHGSWASSACNPCPDASPWTSATCSARASPSTRSSAASTWTRAWPTPRTCA